MHHVLAAAGRERAQRERHLGEAAREREGRVGREAQLARLRREALHEAGAAAARVEAAAVAAEHRLGKRRLADERVHVDALQRVHDELPRLEQPARARGRAGKHSGEA